MDIQRNQFHVTLFSNASKEMFPDNSLTAFTTQLAQPINQDSALDWKVGLAEVSYKTPKRQILQGAVVNVVSSINVLI